MTPDPELLRRYVDAHDEAAFAELVRRHVDLVYATALRLAHGNAPLAEDATQAAFTDLARKASGLLNHPSLAGWLHTSARFATLTALRGEQRRHELEQEASAMNESTTTNSAETSWAQLRPLLDEALGHLNERDRDAVLLRFFEEKNYREVGSILGVSENVAQMRVTRALEKLRAQFSRRGVATTAALLTSTLGAHGATTFAPAAFAETVSAKSIAGAATANAVGISPHAWSIFAKARFATLAMILVLVVGVFVLRVMSSKSQAERDPQTDATQVELPRAAPATVTAQTSSATGIPAGAEDLGEINLTTDPSNHTVDPHAPKTFTLKSGLTFLITPVDNNANGSIILTYGAYESNKRQHTRTSVPRDFQPPATSDLNNDYEISAMPRVPVVITFENQEMITFTPVFTPIGKDINDLGVITLEIGKPRKFVLHSGKIFIIERKDYVESEIFTISPPPPGYDASGIIGEVTTASYASEKEYEANSKIGSRGSSSISSTDLGRELRDYVGDNEIVTYILKF